MQIRNLALAFFFIFLLILLILSQILEPREIKISEISGRNIGESVKLAGEIKTIQIKSNVTILSISDETGIINGIIYDKINIEKNKTYYFFGEIKEYNLELELEIEKIMGS